MVNSPYFELFQNDSVDKQLRIEFDGGVITNEELHRQQFELNESLCSESELRFGSCEASSIKFKISNVFIPLKDKWLTVSMTLNGNTAEPFLIGRYKVYSDTLTADRKYRDVVAYDAMYDIINTEMADWYNSILPQKGSKVTMKQFRSSFVSYFGFEQEEAILANDDMIVEKTIDVLKGQEIDTPAEQTSVLTDSALSGADVISCICEINGCFGHIGRDGKFKWIYLPQLIQGLYPANELYPDHAPDYLPYQQKTGHLYPQDSKSTKIAKSYYIKCQYEDFVTDSIDKLQIRQKENDVGAVYPPGNLKKEDNCYIIENNFLVYGKNSSDLNTIAKNIFGKICNISYRPFEADCKGNLCFEIGDPVKFITKYDIIESYILQRTINGIQALRDDYSADGARKYEKKVNSVNRQIIELKGRTNTLKRTVDETVSELRDTAKGLSSRIEQTVKSISMSVSNDENGKTAEVKLLITDEGGTQYEVTADKIDFKGLVSFHNLTTSGETIINGDNIKTGSLISLVIDNGNGTFHVDENGNLIANDATIYGNLFGLNRLALYNTVKGTHRTVVEVTNADDPDSAKFLFKKPVGGNFLIVDEQEGVYFPNLVKFKNIEVHNNIRFRGETGGNNAITALAPDAEARSILEYDMGSKVTTVGMRSMDDTATYGETITVLRGNKVLLGSSSGTAVTSDERLKNSFKPLDEFDDVYMAIIPCAFKYNNGTSGRFHFGAKAQDVKKAFEKNGYTTQDFGGFVQMQDNPKSEDYCGIDDPMGLIYTEFTMWNMHMVQKLYKKLNNQQEEIDTLKKQVSFLMRKLNEKEILKHDSW